MWTTMQMKKIYYSQVILQRLCLDKHGNMKRSEKGAERKEYGIMKKIKKGY